MRIFFVAGEASGDAYATALGQRLRELDPSVRLEGVGGASLRSLGVKLAADSSTWGSIGIFRSVLAGPKILLGLLQAAKQMKVGSPGVFVAIDFGFANIRVCRFAKRHGWKVLYFIPPGSWNRKRQGKDLPAITDQIVTPFSWSAEILNNMGARAHWFGHPLVQLANQTEIPSRREGVAVLPGSRLHEISSNLPVIAQVVNFLAIERVELAVAPNWEPSELRKMWESVSGRSGDIFTKNDTFGVLARAKAAIVCSGTATLQAAIMDCPQIVVYRFSKGMEMEARVLGLQKKIKRISLPNIFLERDVIPELVQYDFNAESGTRILGELFDSKSERTREQHAAYAEIRQMLGGDDAIDRTADLIIEMARSRNP